MKKIISIILMISFSVMTVACSGVQVPVRTASDVRNVKPNDQYRYSYKVTFVNGETYTVDGDDLDNSSDAIGIRFGNEREFRYYAPDQITGIKRKLKRRTTMGALIGVGAGTAVGVGSAVAVAKTSCNGRYDGSECEFPMMITALGIGFAGPILGTAIGAVIGAGIKQKKKSPRVKVNVSPKVYTTKKMEVQGAGLGISGSF